ncbi:MAG: hypothetical protein AAFR56_05245 [Chloroflexota bacterium]
MTTTQTTTTQMSRTVLTEGEWQMVIVRRTRGTHVNVRMLPAEERGNAVTTVHRGQQVSLRLDMVHEGWVPIRVERLAGWVYLDDIRYLAVGPAPAPPPPPKPAPVQKKQSSLVQRLIDRIKGM